MTYDQLGNQNCPEMNKISIEKHILIVGRWDDEIEAAKVSIMCLISNTHSSHTYYLLTSIFVNYTVRLICDVFRNPFFFYN